MNPSDLRGVIIRAILQGKPTAWKRPVSGRGTNIRYDSQTDDKAAHSLLIKRQILEQLKMTLVGPLFPVEVPVRMIVTYYFKPPPKGSLPYPSNCDLDNCVKYTQDMLQSFWLKGVLWHDDKQVTELVARKRFAHAEYTQIELEGIF